MNEKELYTAVQNVFAMLNADELPEVHEYLANIMVDDEEIVATDPYEIANELLQCDKPEALPTAVITFIEELFEAAFENGNADAMNDLGAQYYDGSRGFPQNFTRAVHCYNKAAEKGSRQAQENLGYCYYYGRNMPVDYEKAFHYFALCAFDGHLISLCKIGDMYASGYYVPKNEVEAFNIYNRCIDTMTDEAAPIVAGPVFLRLGKCFLNGVGTKVNYESALVCYQRAELYLYDMVKNGDYMYKKSLQAAIDGQAKAREKMAAELPSREWTHD